ncbi:MAG TPA: HD domain-containing protein [Candidatus Saccharimonadales bacterium]|nr:HD domain-containing protein [Candidatus Saccharimonadales bacterium]
MIPDIATIQKLHQKYAHFAEAPGLDDRVFTHCRIVSEIALWCADNVHETVDREVLQATALLHDIGTYPFFDAQGKTDGRGFYPLHSILGAKIVLDEGFDPRIARAIETHLLMGLSQAEITDTGVREWPLPLHDYRPKTIEGELLCYADRFHTKKPKFNDPQTFLKKLEQNLPAQADRFKAAMERFGVPDLATLAKKYQHPVV